jgi:hypothetical protein
MYCRSFGMDFSSAAHSSGSIRLARLPTIFVALDSTQISSRPGTGAAGKMYARAFRVSEDYT